MSSRITVKLFFGALCMLFSVMTAAQTPPKKVDSLRQQLKLHPKDIKTNSLAFEALRKWNRDTASAFVTKLLINAEENSDTLFIAFAYNCKAFLMIDAKKTAGAIPFFKKSIAYLENRKDSAAVSIFSNSCRNLGFQLSNLGKYTEAEPWFEEAMKGYSSVKDSASLAGTYLVYGQCEKDRGNYDLALKILFEGLSIAEKRKDDKAIGRLLNNLANVYVGQNKYDDAITFYEKALVYKKKLGLKDEIGNTYGNIGVAYYEKKNYDKALEYYRLSLPMKLAAEDTKGAASTMNNIGLVFVDKKMLDSAEVYVKKSLDMRKEMGDETGMASSQCSLAEIYNKTSRCNKALPLALGATDLAKKNGAREILERAYAAASNSYRCMGNFHDATDYLQSYVDLHDSLLHEASMQQAEDMKAKYEYDKQQQRISDLQTETKLKEAADEAKKKANDANEKQQQYIVWACAIIAVLVILFLVIRQRENQKSKLVLERAYTEIETKNKNITDSIRYAQRIQRSILPDPEIFKSLFPDSFILYKPKDIVSGDFYWIHKTPQGQSVLAVADCTGHGVPGAFMSVMGADILSQATNNKDIDNPATALSFLDAGVRAQLRQKGSDDESRDGMDIALGLFDFNKRTLQFAGALRPLLIVRNKEVLEFDAARFSIGGAYKGNKDFFNHTVALEKDDMIYLFTDGFSDQFGGPDGKKYKSARLKTLLVSIASLPVEQQQQKLDEEFAKWKGILEQVDDICIAGVRI